MNAALETFKKETVTFSNKVATSSPEDNAMAWMKLCKDISVFTSGTAERIIADSYLNRAAEFMLGNRT